MILACVSDRGPNRELLAYPDTVLPTLPRPLSALVALNKNTSSNVSTRLSLEPTYAHKYFTAAASSRLLFPPSSVSRLSVHRVDGPLLERLDALSINLAQHAQALLRHALKVRLGALGLDVLGEHVYRLLVVLHLLL